MEANLRQSSISVTFQQNETCLNINFPPFSNKNIDKVPKDFRFGKLCIREMCGVLELLRDPNCNPCRIKRELYYWIASLNKLRDYIKRRRDKFIDLKELHDKFVFYDKVIITYPFNVKLHLTTCFKSNKTKLDIYQKKNLFAHSTRK